MLILSTITLTITRIIFKDKIVNSNYKQKMCIKNGRRRKKKKN